MRRRPFLACALSSSLALAVGLAAPATGQDTPKPKANRAPDPAFATVEDQPGLPRVLLIGDSISIGYTVTVQKALAGQAKRPPHP